MWKPSYVFWTEIAWKSTKQEGSENSPTYQRDLEVSDQPHSIHYIIEMADT